MTYNYVTYNTFAAAEHFKTSETSLPVAEEVISAVTLFLVFNDANILALN